MKGIFEMLRRVVTLTNVITDTGYLIILLLIYFVSALTFADDRCYIRICLYIMCTAWHHTLAR